MPRLLLPLVVLLALALPASASAAEGFLGVLADGRTARFTDASLPGLTTPRAIAGLGGDRVVALAPGFALGRGGALYRLDAGGARATPTPVRLALPGGSLSLVPEPSGRIRVLSTRGQDLLADPATGAVAPGPGLRLASGEPVAPVVARLPDGRLAGVDAARAALVVETAPGSGVLAETPLRTARGARVALEEPLAFAVAGGRGLLLSRLPGSDEPRQSRLIGVDLATGRTRGEAGPYLYRELAAFVPVGTVPDDRSVRARVVRLPARVSLRALERGGRLRLAVRAPEGISCVVSLVVGGRSNLNTLAGRDTPGTLRIALQRLTRGELEQLRRRIGRRASVRVSVRDWSGNRQVVERSFRVVR